LAERDLTGIYHTPGKDCLNRYEQGIQIAEIFKFDKSLIDAVDSKMLSQIAKRPKNLCLNTEKASNTLKTKLLSFKDGITNMKISKKYL